MFIAVFICMFYHPFMNTTEFIKERNSLFALQKDPEKKFIFSLKNYFKKRNCDLQELTNDTSIKNLVAKESLEFKWPLEKDSLGTIRSIFNDIAQNSSSDF